MENAADKAEQRFKAAVFADEAAHGRDKDRDHDRLKHPGRAGAHVPQQLGRVHRTGGEHDDGAGENAGQQHEEHVNARHAANEHQQIRDGLQQMVFRDLYRANIAFQREHEDQRQRHQRRRKRNAEVCAEFVLHFAALRAAGGDGRIGDEREIVAEHRTAHDGADAQRQMEPRRLRHGNGDGDDQRDRAAGRAHGRRDEA